MTSKKINFSQEETLTVRYSNLAVFFWVIKLFEGLPNYLRGREGLPLKLTPQVSPSRKTLKKTAPQKFEFPFCKQIVKCIVKYVKNMLGEVENLHKKISIFCATS